jgi:hypothetical protein
MWPDVYKKLINVNMSPWGEGSRNMERRLKEGSK